MSRKTEKVTKEKQIQGNSNNKWSVAFASDDDQIKALLDDDWEPFAVDQGLIYFKKKN